MNCGISEETSTENPAGGQYQWQSLPKGLEQGTVVHVKKVDNISETVDLFLLTCLHLVCLYQPIKHSAVLPSSSYITSLTSHEVLLCI